MEPRIQYAQTTDGVSIAYWTMGEGPPFVYMPSMPWSHIEMAWQNTQQRRLSERVANKRRLVQYDNRGSGLSDRDVVDYSLEAHLLDLDAVVDDLHLERFAVVAPVHAGPVAIAYAARQPERVSHLVLWCTYARASDFTAAPQAQALGAMADKDWRIYTRTVAQVVLGWSVGKEALLLATNFLRESTTQEAARAIFAVLMECDVSNLLPEVKAPTLVAHRRGLPWPEVGLARGLASRIPNARLVLLEGRSVMPDRAMLTAVDEFLGDVEDAEPKSELPEGMAVILFADIVESTALTEKLGDAAFREKARELDTSLRGIIRECSGTPVEGKLVGDGVLAVFTAARQAIECALRCNGAGESVGLQLHVGVHAGDVIREGSNVFGGAVNIAARIAGASEPGDVLVSDTVRGLARTSAGVTFDDRGEHTLKGIEEPQRLFAVRGGADG